MKERVMVFCAHSDDQILGVGGTMAKYAGEGKEVSVVVFSFGEMTHPWLRRRYSASMRVKESQKAARIVGAKETTFLGLKEGHFEEEFNQKGLGKTLSQLVQKLKPTKVFTHSENDPHPDHIIVNKLVLGIIDNLTEKPEVYGFDIWNPLNIRRRNSPKLYVDISSTFDTKVKAISCFASQRIYMLPPLVLTMIRNMLDGLSNNCRFAERFYKVR